MASDDILSLPPPKADLRIAYGSDSEEFGDLRLPHSKPPYPIVMNIHGGYWRNKYDLAHAGHLCAALAGAGLATWNVEYRRVGNSGGGWPGTFEDILKAYRFIAQMAKPHRLDASRIVVMGHSAGGQLALCLAAHDQAVRRVVSLAGVLDLQRAWSLHLSNNAVAEFLGGPPDAIADHYREADPMRLPIAAEQWIVQGKADEVVPPDFARRYSDEKKKRDEQVILVEIDRADHFDLIDPRSQAWPEVQRIIQQAMS